MIRVLNQPGLLGFMSHGFLNIAQLRNKKTCFTCWIRHGNLWIKHDIEIRRTVFYFIFLFAGKKAKKCFPLGFFYCIAATTHQGKHQWKDGSIPLQKKDKTLCSCQSVPYFQQSVFHVLPRLRTVTTTTYLVSGNLTQWLGCFNKNGWVTGWGATLVSFYFGKTGRDWLWTCNGRGWTFFLILKNDEWYLPRN